jgi:putative hemolysin
MEGMKIGLGVFAAFILIIMLVSGCITESPDIDTNDYAKTARAFIEISPTYKFDGSGLKLAGVQKGNCDTCFVYPFTFTSSHAGYGDRTNQIVAQVLTTHTAVVTVDNGRVVSAIIDDKWDEIAQEYLTVEQIGGQKDEHGCLIPAGYSWCEEKQKCLRVWEESCEPGNSQIANPASVYCVEQGGEVIMRDTPGGQAGYCRIGNDTCEEWQYYRSHGTLCLVEVNQNETGSV